MAAPVDAGRATYDGSSSATSHAVTMPASIAAGDILVAVLRPPAARTITAPAGWEEMKQESPDTADDTTALFLKVADGAEGSTQTFTLSSAARLAALTYRITGATNASVSTSAIGTTGQPDSPSLTIASSRDVLWLSIGGGSNALTLTSGPSGYSNATLIAHTGGGATDGTTAAVFSASKQATAVTTEDPGAWTLGGTLASWVMYTVAVYSGPMTARLSSEPVEAVVSPTSQVARLSSEPVEVIASPTDQEARLSSESVEAIVLPSSQIGRLSSEVVEVLVENSATPPRLSQLVVEVIMENISVGQSFYAYVVD